MDKTLRFRSIAPCLFAVVVDILGFGLALPVLTGLFTATDFLPASMGEAHRYSYLAIGLALYPFFMFFGSSFMGDLSDIIGRKKVLLICMGGFFVGFFLMGIGVISKSVAILFIGRGLTGLTAASLPTTMAAITDMSTPQTKAKNMSYVVLAQCVGFVLGPLMGGLLSRFDKNPISGAAFPFFAAGILALCAFVSVIALFQESFQRGDKHLHPLRIFLVFVEAARHSKIRLLTIAFLLHQIGVGIFLQLILIYLQKKFAYTTFGMGLFNSFLGIWLGLGIFLLHRLEKKCSIEKLAYLSLAFLGLTNIGTAFSSLEWLIWGWLLPFGISSIIAWSAMLTSFSNAVDERSQGWALGITGAVAALSFIITGFAPNLVPHFGVMPIIALSGILVLIGSTIVAIYCRLFLPKHQ
ncbi:MAG: MFS transporter [Chlamydiia bacterium]|nr:MFS transporter [Chlamydiia bacterium]